MVIDLWAKNKKTAFSEQELRIKQFANNADSQMVRMAHIADVQLMLTYERSYTREGFDDLLSLELSDEVKSEPLRHRTLEEVHLRGVCFEPSVGRLSYSITDIPGPGELAACDPDTRFYKKDGSRVFVATKDDIVSTGKDLIAKVESILESRWLFDVSVQGLEYFFPAQIGRFSEFPFTPYLHTSYKDTHGFKDWLAEQDKGMR